MAKVSSIERNKRIQKTIQKYSNKRKELKLIMNDKQKTLEERFKAMVKLSEMPRSSSKVRYRNRCSISGRPRGVFRFFGLCRNMIRKLASFGRLPGVKKSSW